jgi:hypothetical protein
LVNLHNYQLSETSHLRVSFSKSTIWKIFVWNWFHEKRISSIIIIDKKKKEKFREIELNRIPILIFHGFLLL